MCCRYIAIVHPLVHKFNLTRKKVYIGIVITWIVGPAYNTPWDVLTSAVVNNVCVPAQLYPNAATQLASGVLLVVVEYFLPLAVMAVCYGHMLIILRRRVARSETGERSTTKMTSVGVGRRNEAGVDTERGGQLDVGVRGQNDKSTSGDDVITNSDLSASEIDICEQKPKSGGTVVASNEAEENKIKTSSSNDGDRNNERRERGTGTRTGGEKLVRSGGIVGQAQRGSEVLQSTGLLQDRASRNVFKTLITVCALFVLCWSCNELYYFQYLLGGSINFSGIFYNFTVFAIFANCCVNPIVYTVQYKEFQLGLARLFGKAQINSSSLNW